MELLRLQAELRAWGFHVTPTGVGCWRLHPKMGHLLGSVEREAEAWGCGEVGAVLVGGR